MKILLINTSEFGGAAVACKRLMKALKLKKIDTNMLVANTQDSKFNSFYKTYIGRKIHFLKFVYERICFLLHEKSKEIRFVFSLGNIGANITKNKEVNNTDIIHLHWFNQGFLSLKNLKQISKLNKPVVWTLHDMWAFTGGCHYSLSCRNFEKNCGNCIYVKKANKKDLSNKIHKKKQKIYSNLDFTIVTCSNWLKQEAQKSSLLQNFNIVSIPNPIDTQLFKPIEGKNLRLKYNIPTNKKIILFGAANINNKIKGMPLLFEALDYLYTKDNSLINKIELIVVGKSKPEDFENIKFKIHNLGSINSEKTMIEIYNLADLFVTPSLQDNLPNMIMESLAVSTPVVGFNIGGIPEMVDHKKNGYIANYKSTSDLAEGILWCFYQTNFNNLKIEARNKVLKSYSEEIIAEKFKNLYQSISK